MTDEQPFFARRDSDDHLFVQFTPGTWQARGREVPATLPTNTNTYSTPTYGGRHVGRVDIVGAEGSDRRVILFPELVGFDMETRVRFRASSQLGFGQFGLVNRGLVKPDGHFHGFVGWNNVVFGAFWTKLNGYWNTFRDNPVMENVQAEKDMRILLDPLPSAGGFRSGGNTTVDVPVGHDIVAGNLVSVSGNGALDIGLVAVTSVTANTIVYPQAGGDTIVPSTTGIVRNHSKTDLSYDMALRTTDNVSVLKTWRSNASEPAWDNSDYVFTFTDTNRASNYRQGSPGLVVAHFTTGGYIEFDWLESFLI